MQATGTPRWDIGQLALAYVEDAHNIGCVVRYLGGRVAERARYAAKIQEHGVVIRAGHVVVVDRSVAPPVVIWRMRTVGTVEHVDGPELTVNLGYRTLALPLRDERPEAERARPIAAGDRVLLRGSPVEQASITDVLVGGEPAHPDRLRAHLRQVVERLAQA
jgi:hypothetical protein